MADALTSSMPSSASSSLSATTSQLDSAGGRLGDAVLDRIADEDSNRQRLMPAPRAPTFRAEPPNAPPGLGDRSDGRRRCRPVPPVRAAVRELLHIGGIVVREEPGPRPQPSTPSSGPADPWTRRTSVTLDEARRVLVRLRCPRRARATRDRGGVPRGPGGGADLGDGAAVTRLDVFAGF